MKNNPRETRLETIIYNLIDHLDESLGRCDKSDLVQILSMEIGMTEEEIEEFAGDLLDTLTDEEDEM